jgi:import receptor subunit TOM20
MEKKKVVPLLVARLIGRQVAVETQKMLPNPSGLMHTSDIPEAEGGEYSLYDHIERLRYLEMSTEKKEVTLVKEVLQTALPGLEDFVTDERYAMLLGKMAYNSYGVCFGGGRDNRVGD